MKFTPKPWLYRRFTGQSDYTVYTHGATIARVPLRDVSIVQQEYNARLIALAPELLAFVQAYMNETLDSGMITDMADLLVLNFYDKD